MSGRVVDAKCYSGSDELEQEREKAERTLGFFVTYCNNRGLAAKAYVSFGTDPVEELTSLAEEIRADFPHSMFFTSKLIFDIPTMIAGLSEGMTLEAGDIILSGTPEGVGFARKPPDWGPLRSRGRPIEMTLPWRTRRAAAVICSGPTWLSAPSWSSSPHRPQLENRSM